MAKLTPTEYEMTIEKIAKINARAEKKGFTGRIELTAERKVETTEIEKGVKVEVVYYDATISGQAPKYNGWEFLAAVDTVVTESGKNEYVIRNAPGTEETDIDRSILSAGQCMHCGIEKSNRLYTYLVHNAETGQSFQVGSTCIKDFTGWQGRFYFIPEDDMESELFGSSGSFRQEFSPKSVVTIAMACVEAFGYVPAGSFDSMSTKSAVLTYFFPAHIGKAAEQDRALIAEITPFIEKAAQNVDSVMSALLDEFRNGDGYAGNMFAALSAVSVADKHFGLVCSAPVAYRRLTEGNARREQWAAEKAEREAAKSARDYAGAIGEKIEFSGKVAKAMTIDGTYGPSRLVVIESENSVVKTFTTAAWAWDLEEGETITIKATVKSHDEYMGELQTMVNRPKRIDG